MKKIVSIIVPLYNKEDFLTSCIESLINLNIDHNEIEAIFVDDCSTDSSLQIVKKYAEQYAFIKVIQLETNTGSPSTPRNVGIKEATGKYITLLDADDWLDIEGFPKFIAKVNEDNADFGLAASFKHTNKSVTYHAKFTSYKDTSHMKPTDIEKIFRAVGPPGKVFKREIVINNQLEFEHMKFGEDKLFFTQLISKVENITMSTLPMYHVNRLDENLSLVQETSVLDKGYINKGITERICEMDIPLSLKEMALSRMIEVDFFRRLLHTKTFLKSDNKAEFFNVISDVEAILNNHGFNMQQFINNKIFITMYHLYKQQDKDALINFISDVVHGRWHLFIEDGTVYKTLERHYDSFKPIPIACYPVYLGTQFIDGEMYDVIHMLTDDHFNINSVNIVEVNNVTKSQFIDFEYRNDKVYIKQQAFTKVGSSDVNIRINFNDIGTAIVYASYPSNNALYKMKRQSFKLEFTQKQKKAIQPKYFTQISGPIIATKKIKLYRDLEFNDAIDTLEPGAKLEPISIQYSSNGTPRLVLEDGSLITANKKFVTLFDTNNLDKYITTVPKQVKVIKACKLYDTRSFTKEPIKKLNAGDTLKINNIIYTNNSTPRLVTEDGHYVTANKDFVDVIKS